MFALLACTSGTPAATVAPAAEEPTGSLAACLTEADRLDGAEDQVVRRCPACGLGMDGDPTHRSSIGGYDVHSCSSSCQQSLDAQPTAMMMRACAKTP